VWIKRGAAAGGESIVEVEKRGGGKGAPGLTTKNYQMKRRNQRIKRRRKEKGLPQKGKRLLQTAQKASGGAAGHCGGQEKEKI